MAEFIGQTKIVQELSFILPELQRGRNMNFIFRAPSGYGKTKLARLFAYNVDRENCYYEIPDEAGNISPDYSWRIIVIDEIHTLRQPEILYPHMDDGKHIFILCSNEFGALKEPLVNRCLDFIFELYSENEIAQICRKDFEFEHFHLPDEFLTEVARNSNGNPRIARANVKRLSIIFRSIGEPHTIEELRNYITEHLQIENGLNQLHRRYLEYLAKVTRASLDSISFATRLDKNTIKKEIEPVLLSKMLISIDSRGRHLL